MISFDVSQADRTTIAKIARRAVKVFGWKNAAEMRSEIAMDLTATHANGNPLRLNDLLDADDFNLMHDVGGIRKHLDRETGALVGFFCPRFSKPESVDTTRTPQP